MNSTSVQSEVALAERDHTVETFVADGSDEASRVSVGIWRLKRRLHDPDARLLE